MTGWTGSEKRFWKKLKKVLDKNARKWYNKKVPQRTGTKNEIKNILKKYLTNERAYDIIDKHFGWETEGQKQTLAFVLESWKLNNGWSNEYKPRKNPEIPEMEN